MDMLLCKIGAIGEPQIEESLEKMGYQVHGFSYDTDSYDTDEGFFRSFLQMMKEKRYGFVFSLYFMPIISKVCQIFNTVYISWIYDFPELHLYAKAMQNSVNRIFVFDRIQYERFHAVSPATIFYMPLATKPMTEEELAGIPLAEQEELCHDICFIGNLHNSDDSLHNRLLQLPDYWKGFVQGIVEAQLNVYGYNFIADALTKENAAELKRLLGYVMLDDYQIEDREIIADMYIGGLCSRFERGRILGCLSEKHEVVVYTKSDTKEFPNVINKGFAEPIFMAPKIYHCSKINLNITVKTIQSGIPLRVFDVLGSKGFLITNYQREICDYFEPGVDLVIYDSITDLQQKVAYYLEHEEERRQIAANGYRKVCEYFTYDIAVSEILDMAGIL